MAVTELEQALHGLEGKTVWAMGVCAESGADFLLKAGEKWRTPAPHRKSGYAEHGEAALYVKCRWQLQQADKVILTSTEIWATDDRWAEGLDQLQGYEIRSVDVGGESITLTFDDDRKLIVCTNESDLESAPLCIFSTGQSDQFMIAGGRPVEHLAPFSPEELAGLERIA